MSPAEVRRRWDGLSRGRVVRRDEHALNVAVGHDFGAGKLAADPPRDEARRIVATTEALDTSAGQGVGEIVKA